MATIRTIRNSILNILNNEQQFEINDNAVREINENPNISDLAKLVINNNNNNHQIHTIIQLRFSDILPYVWARIVNHPNMSDLIAIFSTQMEEQDQQCFTGALSRLISCLSGFYDDVNIQISEKEQINNIIIALRRKYDENEIKSRFIEEMRMRGYTDEVINEHLAESFETTL